MGGSVFWELGKKVYGLFRGHAWLQTLAFKVGWCAYISLRETLRNGFTRIFIAVPRTWLHDTDRSAQLFLWAPSQGGLFHLYFPDASLMLLVAEIFSDREYTKQHVPQAGETVVDVGANIGVFAVMASRLVGQRGSVICIEPEPKNLHSLQTNLRLNYCKNVTVVAKGAWSKKAALKLWLLDGNIAAHSVVIHRSRKFTTIKVDTLDRILKGKLVDFVKMDIEGAEIEAVKGMKKMLKQPGIKLAVAAYHKVRRHKHTSEVLVPSMRKAGLNVELNPQTHFMFAKRE